MPCRNRFGERQAQPCAFCVAAVVKTIEWVGNPTTFRFGNTWTVVNYAKYARFRDDR